MNLLYPRFTLRQFGWMMVFGLASAAIAGAYGVIHDQVTFSIGSEYFTRFKFATFHYLDTTGPERLVVAQIGFLAAAPVGFFAGWFMGRLTVPHLPIAVAARESATAVLAMLIVAIAFAAAGSLMAPVALDDPRLEHWQIMLDSHRVSDALSFVKVGYIHNASYLGALVGLIAALVWLRLTRRKWVTP